MPRLTIIIDRTPYNWHEIDPGRAQRAHVIDKTIDQMRARIREMEEEKRALVDGTRADFDSLGPGLTKL